MDQERRDPGDLPDLWRHRAHLLQEWGADPSVARIWEMAALELERSLRASADSTLNLTQAAKLCGYTPDHLGELVRSGKIPNYGRKGAPRVKLSDLPVKVHSGSEKVPAVETSKLAMKLLR